MTVRCLNRVQKNAVVKLYVEDDYKVSQLAQVYQVSRKTIYRILDEQKTRRPRRPRKSKQSLAVTARIHAPVTVPKPSFLRRITASLRRALTPVASPQ